MIQTNTTHTSSIFTALACATMSVAVAHSRITALENNSSNPAHLISSQLMIEPRTKRAVFVPLELAIDPQVRRPLAIVIPSIASLTGKYREQFISGEPYFPEEALQVQTLAGTYALWEDEVGIMQALQFVPGVTLRDACVPRYLARHQAQQSAFEYTLIINREGGLQLL